MDRRNTLQRQLVLGAVRSLHHPDAEEVYGAVAEAGIGKATVYRNLHLLAACGDIRRIDAGDGPTHYDGRTEAHYHLHCRVCGRLFDATMRPLAAPEIYLERTDGFTVEGHELLFVGICSDCKNKQKGDDKHG